VTGQQIVEFSDVLSTIYKENGFRRLLLSINRTLQALASAADPFPDQVLRVVEVANAEGWLAVLVGAVTKAQSNNRAVRQFLADHPDWDVIGNAPASHPCDTLRIFGGRSFLGRKPFREHLKRMDELTGKKVLLITSAQRKVGKTYSRELVQFMAMNIQNSGTVYVDLDKVENDPAVVAAKIAQDLGLAAGGGTVGGQQAARGNHDLVDWLVPTNQQPRGRISWILLDGFRERLASEALQDLIAQLAQRIQSTANYRLILINYSYTLPLAVDAFTLKEQVEPLARGDVEHFLGKIHELKFGAPPSAEKLAEYVDGVYETVQEFTAREPQSAGDQLLLNTAATKARDVILG